MPKFILVKDYHDFDKIREYIKNNPNTNYYLSTSLMYVYLCNLKYRCVIGLNMKDIKSCERNSIDLLTVPAYTQINRSADLFKIEAIKDEYLINLNYNRNYDFIVFGIDADVSNFTQYKIEKI